MADGLDWLARLGVAFYFLWAAWFNYGARDFHAGEFRRIGIAQGQALVIIGIAWKVLASILLLWPPTAAWGAAMLIVFIVLADACFHRYWTYDAPQERTMHQFFLFEHVALIGGLLAIIANHMH
jgi:uncharacterized membrane protein YphA (DoxX/SURF4 family)